MADTPHIGNMRYRVTLGTRQAQESGTAGITETITGTVTVWADIRPLGTQLYLAGRQISDDEVTHRIITRHRSLPSMFDTATRTVPLPDGTTRTDTYRILRTTEWEGRKQWLVMEARLEGSTP